MDWPLPNTGENMGGCTYFYFIDANNLLGFTETDPVSVSSLILKEGAALSAGYATFGSLMLESIQETTNHGPIYRNTVKGFYPKPDPVLLNEMLQMANSRFVLLIKLNNGQTRVAGTKEQPLSFSFRDTTAQRAQEIPGVEFAFTGATRMPAKYYPAGIEMPALSMIEGGEAE